MQTYLIGSSSFAYALAKAYALNSIRGLLYCKFFFSFHFHRYYYCLLCSLLVSVRLSSFYFGGSKLVRFLAKIEHTPMKLLYFVNRPNMYQVFKKYQNCNFKVTFLFHKTTNIFYLFSL